MKFGVIYQSFDPPEVFLEYVRLIEDAGFDFLWVCDSSLHARDVFSYLTLAAVHTRRLRLGVSIVQPYTRHPALNVNAMATVNELSGGRAIMAVGTGDRPQAELGFAPAPLHLVRDMIDVSRRLLGGQTVTFENTCFQLKDARLRSYHRTSSNEPASNEQTSPNDSAGNGQTSPLPIYVACSGPKMLALAGELADGVIMLCGANRQGLEFALKNLQCGLERSQRSRSQLDVAWGAATVIADDPTQALEQTRVMAAWYANHAPAYARQTGAPQALVDAMNSARLGSNLHEARAAAALAPDSMVDQLALAGPPRHIIQRLEVARDLGIDHFELFLIGPDKLNTLRRFAREIMPAFRC